MNIEEQTRRLEQLYVQLTGSSPLRAERPVAPIPADVDPVQWVEGNLRRLDRTLNGLREAASGPMPFGNQPVATPARVTVLESEHSYRLLFELPGVRAQEVSLRIEQGTLLLTAVRTLGLAESTQPSNENPEPHERPMLAEVMPCRFERALPLPPFVRAESARATLENGVLTVVCARDPHAIRCDLKIEVA